MVTCDGHAGGLAARAPGSPDGSVAQLDGRGPDGRFLPGNACSRRHGRRSMTARLRQRETTAAMKLARHLLVAASAMPGRCRPRRLRPDQMALLAVVDPAGLRIATALGVALPSPDRLSRLVRNHQS
jgi:hypothetical protein